MLAKMHGKDFEFKKRKKESLHLAAHASAISPTHPGPQIESIEPHVSIPIYMTAFVCTRFDRRYLRRGTGNFIG
jgi:hypothetical protein